MGLIPLMLFEAEIFSRLFCQFCNVGQANQAALQTHDKPSKTGEVVYSIAIG